MPSDASCIVFYSHFQSKFIITKSNFTIIARLGINDAKSISDLILLTVGSPINVGRFNKCRQPTGLTTYIYYLI